MKYLILILYLSNVIFAQTSNHTTSILKYDSTYQVSINSNMPPLTGVFKIYELQNGNIYSTVYNFQFINSINNTLCDEIIDTVFNFSYFPGKEFIDANFDGNLDLLTVVDRDAKAQPSYKFWIFNPQENLFQLNQEFSDSLVCHVNINSEESTISSGCQIGCMGHCGTEITYQVIKNHLFRVGIVESREVEIDGEWKIKVTTRRLINGKMIVVDEYYYDYP